MWSPIKHFAIKHAARVAAVLTVLSMGASLAACGFHLRGKETALVWPVALATISLKVDGGVKNGPDSALISALRGRLRVRHGVQFVNTAAPVMYVSEAMKRSVLTVDSAGKAVEYVLMYSVRARVIDGKTVRVEEMILRDRRTLRFDSKSLLASEAEERRLREEMARAMARQIIRRIAARMKPDKP